MPSNLRPRHPRAAHLPSQIPQLMNASVWGAGESFAMPASFIFSPSASERARAAERCVSNRHTFSHARSQPQEKIQSGFILHFFYSQVGRETHGGLSVRIRQSITLLGYEEVANEEESGQHPKGGRQSHPAGCHVSRAEDGSCKLELGNQVPVSVSCHS